MLLNRFFLKYVDNVCIDSMSVKITKRLLERCSNSIQVLETTIQK